MLRVCLAGATGWAGSELARKARAPVKLMLDRAEEVTVGGNRPSAYGTIRIAGTRERPSRANMRRATWAMSWACRT